MGLFKKKKKNHRIGKEIYDPWFSEAVTFPSRRLRRLTSILTCFTSLSPLKMGLLVPQVFGVISTSTGTVSGCCVTVKTKADGSQDVVVLLATYYYSLITHRYYLLQYVPRGNSEVYSRKICGNRWRINYHRPKD